MSYDGFYSELSSRGTANDALNQVVTLKDKVVVLAAEAEVSADRSENAAAIAEVKSTEAINSAAAALTSKESAEISETSAGLSAQQAAIALVATSRFCGVSATAPSARLDGSALQQADEWHNSVDKLRYSWSGTAWVALNSSAQQLEVRLGETTSASEGSGQIGNNILTVGTVAEMVALTGWVVGKRVKTLGYYFAGDGGGNEYLVVPAGTGVADGGMYIGLIGAQAKGLFPERSVLTKQFGIQGNGALVTPASTMQKVIDTSLSDDATGAWGPDTLVNPGTVILDGTISVAGGRHLSGKGGQNTTKLVAKGSSFDVTKDSIVDLVGAFTVLNNLGIRVDVDLYDPIANTGTPVDCISVESANAFGNTIRDLRANGGATGIRVRMGLETKIFGSFIVGSRIGIDITAWDTEINNTIIQDTPNYGVQTTRGLESAMLHVVRAGVAAIYLRDSGNPVNMINTFIDTPLLYGFRLAAQRGSMITNTYILKIGGETGDPAATGVSLSSASTGNAFIGGHVVNTHTNFLGVFNFDNTSINNVIAFWRITAKSVAPAAVANMRKQTVIGCMEDAARYNNVPRKNRVATTGVAVGATTDIVLTLDYTYPALTFNTLLFYGKWISRNSASQGAFGDMYLPVQFGDSGCAPVVTKTSGHANNTWGVTAVALSGNLLTVTVQNNGTSTASISIEIERSMDATGVTF